MNNSIDPSAVLEQSIGNAAERYPSGIFASMFLPARLYEALPTVYIAVGTLLTLGAVYIGLGHTPMVGYLAVGLTSILGGVTLSSIRRRERSKSRSALA